MKKKDKEITLDSRYGANFTIRLTMQEANKLKEVSKEDKIRRSTLVRRALNIYYRKREALKEIEVVVNSKNKDLPLLVTVLVTSEGRQALQNEILKRKII